MFKNVASQHVIFVAYDTTTGLLKTGDAANLTAYVSKDTGAVTVLADTSATELDATNAKGCYAFDLAQGETNADMALYTCKSVTANIQLDPVLAFTSPPAWNASVAQTGDNYVRIGAPVGASISADIAGVPTTVWAATMTGTTTAIQAVRGFIAALLGKASGLDTLAPKFRNIADNKDVISATTDANGNRTAVTLDLT